MLTQPSLAGTGTELGNMVNTVSASENHSSGYKKQNCNAKMMGSASYSLILVEA